MERRVGESGSLHNLIVPPALSHTNSAIEKLLSLRALYSGPEEVKGFGERVYRLLAERYHPHKRDTDNLEIFLRLHEAHMVLSDPELRAEYDIRHRGSKSFPGKVPERMKMAAQAGATSFARNVPRRK